MPPIETKAQLILMLNESRDKLEKVLNKLTRDQVEVPGVCGDWSVKDILAHLYDWEERHTGWMEAARRGEKPEVPAPGLGFGATDVDRLNRQIYENHCHETYEEVLKKFRRTHEEFMAQVENTSEADLFTPGVVPFTSGTLANWYRHFGWHDGWGRNQINQKLVRKPRQTKTL